MVIYNVESLQKILEELEPDTEDLELLCDEILCGKYNDKMEYLSEGSTREVYRILNTDFVVKIDITDLDEQDMSFQGEVEHIMSIKYNIMKSIVAANSMRTVIFAPFLHPGEDATNWLDSAKNDFSIENFIMDVVSEAIDDDEDEDPDITFLFQEILNNNDDYYYSFHRFLTDYFESIDEDISLRDLTPQNVGFDEFGVIYLLDGGYGDNEVEYDVYATCRELNVPCPGLCDSGHEDISYNY